MSGSEHVRRRFRVERLEAARDGFLEVSGGPVCHLEVLRAEPGDTVFVFDGHGREFEAEVVEIDPQRARLALRREVERAVESPLRCCLVQAVPARVPRMDTIVRQATELGVDRIVPVFAERSQHRKGQDKAARKAERWLRIADAAAEQSHRRRVPKIDPPCRFTDLSWPTLPQPILLGDPGVSGELPEATGKAGVDAAVARGGDAESPTEATVLIGPEGGWSDAERGIAVSHGAVAIALGPRVLRADTAGVVALAILQQRWGDLG